MSKTMQEERNHSRIKEQTRTCGVLIVGLLSSSFQFSHLLLEVVLVVAALNKGQKHSKTVKIGQKRSKTVKNRQKPSKTVKSGQNWSLLRTHFAHTFCARLTFINIDRQNGQIAILTVGNIDSWQY